MKGFYVYLTQDGVTVLRWFRTQVQAEVYWRDVFKRTETEARIRGDLTYDPQPATVQ